MDTQREQERGGEEERPRQERVEPFFPDYHVVVLRQCSYLVSTAMARHIECELDRWPRPRWITFVDLAGARYRVRAEAIESLEQSTPESRELWRRFREERDREDPPEPFPF
jgi:hypothetical protein